MSTWCAGMTFSISQHSCAAGQEEDYFLRVMHPFFYFFNSVKLIFIFLFYFLIFKSYLSV